MIMKKEEIELLKKCDVALPLVADFSQSYLEDICDDWLEMHEQAVQHEALKVAVRTTLDNSIILKDSS